MGANFLSEILRQTCWLSDMPVLKAAIQWFDSNICVPFAAPSFSSDGSMGNWNDPVLHWMATIFMLSGAIPFVLYVRLAGGSYDALRNSQLLSLLGFLACIITVCAIWLLYKQQYGFEEAFRHAAFNIVSVVTTTGYATLDYSLWGNVAIGMFFGLLFVGGCTGSTSGGMKIFRFEVMALMLYGQFRRLIYPHGGLSEQLRRSSVTR